MRILIFTLLMSLIIPFMGMAQDQSIGDFEDQTMGGWSAWAPATAVIAANPAVNTANPSAYVVKFDQTAEAWKGLAKWFNTPVINQTHVKVCLDVYIVDKTGLVQLYMDNSATGAPSSTNKQVTGIQANTWTRVVFDVTDLAVLDFKQIAFQSDVKGIVYLDNIALVAAKFEEEEPTAGIEWNISSAEFNALGTISATKIVNGLTIYATADKTVVVEPNAKTLDGMEFTTRMKLGGAGSLVAGDVFRVLALNVTGNTTISVAAISSSSSADRELLFINSAGDTLSTKPVLGASISMVTFDYVGGATTINIASLTSGINVYYIKAVSDDAPAKKEIVFVKTQSNNFDSLTIAAIQARDEFNVTVINQSVITADLLDQFNAAAVVIMGRGIGSADIATGKNVWDQITAPVLTMNMWGLRSNRANWTPSATCANMKNANGVYIQGTILLPNDPVFEGLPIGTIDWWNGNYSIFGADAEGDDAGNGVLLAKTPDNRALFMRWEAGVEFYPGAGHSPMGKRSYIGCGSDDGGIVNYFAFSAIAERIFFNELEILAFGEVIANDPPFSTDPYAIFDPATVDPSTLKEGMKIVEMDGKKYLQVIVNGWNSIVDVPQFKFGPGMTAFAEFKYVVAQNQFTAAQINAAVQLIDTINLMKPSWSNDSVSSTTGLIQSNPSGKFVKSSAAAAATMKVVHQVQFFGQETTGWNAVIGDTLWVGKVRAYTKEADVVFDPVTYDPALLPASMKIVEINGKKYCKIALQGWNSSISVNPFEVKAGVYTHMTVEAKYQVGTSGHALSNINTFLKLANAANNVEVVVGGHASSATFKQYKANINTAGTVEMFQVAGQEKTGWNAVTGDTLWVGKVKMINEVPVDPNVVLDPATFDGALGTGWSIVDIGGTKYFKVALDGWNSWMNVPAYTFPAGKNAFKAAVKYEVGTSGTAIENMNAFLKFSTAGWSEIGAGAKQATADFSDQVVTLANNEGNVAGVFQIAAQNRAEAGFPAVSGALLYIGKITAVTTAPVTFVIDDTRNKQYDGFNIRGSWKTGSGIFDSEWNGGVNHATFSDSTAANPVADNIWELTIKMVADGSANVWKWGFLDLEDNWLVVGPDIEFQVKDWTPVTTTYVIGGTDVKELNAKLKIYPNPTSGILNISGIEAKSIEVFNLSGSKVFVNTLSENRIDVSGLAKGSYIVKVIGNKGEVAVSKFNKN